MGEARAVILASASTTRREMLAAAGVIFNVILADVDEAAVREALMADDDGIDAADIAEVLARAKAEQISRRSGDALVIGADQVLACDGHVFAKPATSDAAREMLLQLRGRVHQLHSAVVIAVGGTVEWACVETAHMAVRKFSPEFLGQYLALAGTEIRDSVGAYRLEREGAQLFERVDGDYFTILGLPLLPLLEQLRTRGVLAR